MQLTQAARRAGIIIIGDLVPAHSGKGPDFRLAERAYKNYEGIYTMVQVRPEDWGLLPAVPPGEDSANLSLETAQLLEDKGYIPGPTEVIPFFDPGIKDTCWSATDVVTGVDGQERRWVYLHIFKESQPSFNWLDPTFAAQRIVMGDAVQSLSVWGDSGLRLDANPLLSIEARPGADPSWIEGHPVAVGGSNMIAMMIRKLGGYSFQELNLALDQLKEFTRWGPDLSYDFFTRPPYLCAMATGDAGPLRLILRIMMAEGLDPGLFIHALQNHDELMFNLNHLVRHGDELFSLDGLPTAGRTIYEQMYTGTAEKVLAFGKEYIREFSNLGFCSTLAAFAAAALGITDPYQMTPHQQRQVRQLHLLAAMFNAMQPGVFAISGWDLVGALSLPLEELGAWMEDRDYRWMNRGAFDLMGMNPQASASGSGLPKAAPVYGTLPEQLEDPDSFCSTLRRMLGARKACGVALSRLVSVPDVSKPGLLVMVFQRTDPPGYILTALNFSRERVRETVVLPQVGGAPAHLVFSTHEDEEKHFTVPQDGSLVLDLGAVAGEVYAIA
jgi:trehalose synthase